jgi:hypothetical protein
MNNPQPQNELSYICRTPDYLERLGDPWYVLLAQLLMFPPYFRHI